MENFFIEHGLCLIILISIRYENDSKIIEYPDRRIKAIVSTMISSGIRLGGWNYLKWKHNGKIVAAKNLKYTPCYNFLLNVKIFISYSRIDAGDFANRISETLEEHDVFTDIKNIQIGDIWSNTIEKNIAACDVFLVIITLGALRSLEVEKEVLLAQHNNKKIIPCFYSDIKKNQLKWGLEKLQGIEFATEFQLAREIFSKIKDVKLEVMDQNSRKRPTPEGDRAVLAGKRRILLISGSLVALIALVSLISYNQEHTQPQPETTGTTCKSINGATVESSSDVCLVSIYGSQGNIDRPFDLPIALGIDSSENMYVVETTKNTRIQKLTNDGEFITKWGSQGSDNGEFNFPMGIALDNSDNVYVADSQNNRIQKFSSQGKFITKWGFQGSIEGDFNFPNAIALDSHDNVYVADRFNFRIQKFTSDGTFITKWGSQGSGTGYWDNNGSFIKKPESHGSSDGDGEFGSISGIATDSSDNVYVTDIGNYRIQKFTSDGTFITQWSLGNRGKEYGWDVGSLIEGPIDIVTDSSANVYVLDTLISRIERFKQMP